MQNDLFLNILLTCIPVVCLLPLLLLSAKHRKQVNEGYQIFDFLDSNALRAVFSIVIVFVHVPPIFGNSFQDIIGSFAGVGVAFFFMMSSFGCCHKYYKETPKHFFITFWPKRLVSLFLPNFIINLIFCICSACFEHNFNARYLINFNYYLYAVLVLYLLLFIFFALDTLFKKRRTPLFLYLCLIISISCSIVTYLTKFSLYFLWPVESLFGAIGIVVFIYRKNISNFLNKNTLLVLITSLVFSLCLGVRYNYIKSEAFYIGFVYKFFLILSILTFVISLTVIFKFKKKPICYLANLSFGIYLSHITFIGFVAKLYPEDFAVRSGVYVVTFFGISILVSIIAFLITKPIILVLSKALNRVK